MTTAILLAAGNSSRMGENKLLIDVNGKTALELSYEVCAESNADNIIIVVSKSTEKAASAISFSKPTRIVFGGSSRSESVFNALCACTECDIAVIHDGARCLVTPEIINESIVLAKQYGSAIATTKVRDTIRESSSHKTVDRSKYLLMQTPQTFLYDRIYSAYSENQRTEQNTDDCEYYINAGFTPYYFEAGFANQKLTYPNDKPFFKKLASQRKDSDMIGIRIGQGEDTHRLCSGRALILGGVNIPFEYGLLGHSDADALCHSISDAILGAACLGDIGKHFPDNDKKYEGANSLDLLKQVVALCKNSGYRILNVDATITAQKPKLASYIDKMREKLAAAMNVEVGAVSVKATTPEGLGPEGNLECITVRSVCLICKC